jgi:hypothetical protein
MADDLDMVRAKAEATEEPHVRVATPDEIHAVMELALMGCAENEFLPHDPELVLQDVWAALNRDHGIMGVIGAPGSQPLEGAVLLRIGTIWYSRQPHVEERAIFVHPQFRQARGGRAARLAEFSMDVADGLDMPLTIGVLSASRVEAKMRLYSRFLGKPSGCYWIYWPNSRNAEQEP